MGFFTQMLAPGWNGGITRAPGASLSPQPLYTAGLSLLMPVSEQSGPLQGSWFPPKRAFQDVTEVRHPGFVIFWLRLFKPQLSCLEDEFKKSLSLTGLPIK